MITTDHELICAFDEVVKKFNEERTINSVICEHGRQLEKVIVKNIVEILEKYADKLEDERPNKGFSDVVYESIEILRKAQEK